MKSYLSFILCTFSLLCYFSSPAQINDGRTRKTAKHNYRKFYIGSSFEGAMLSLADVHHTYLIPETTYVRTYGIIYFTGSASNQTAVFGYYQMPEYIYGPKKTDSISSPRFTLFINTGITFNYNLSRHFGLFSGLDLKNIGYQTKNNTTDSITVRRTYNIGIPLGIKIGNMTDRGHYLFLGGGLDMTVNYKEKSYLVTSQKAEFSEWFSTRTAQFMPYIFVGASVYRRFTLKLQYYPGNFLNPDFTVKGNTPYAGYNVNLFLLTVGYQFRFGGKHTPENSQNPTNDQKAINLK